MSCGSMCEWRTCPRIHSKVMNSSLNTCVHTCSFAHQMKAAEIIIEETAKNDPLKQLKLAAEEVNQRLQGSRRLK